MNEMDYYKACSALGVAPGTDMAQIKTVYRSLSKQYHPDNSGGEEAAEKFLLINEAYSYLEKMHEQKLKLYSAPVKPDTARYGRVIGGNLTAHPGSQEARKKREDFEKKHKLEEQKKKIMQQKEMEERLKAMQEEKLQKKKEHEILNEIRMIRLAHAIESVLGGNGGK